MRAAGVKPLTYHCKCNHARSAHEWPYDADEGTISLAECKVCPCRRWEQVCTYPDPLTPKGFVALWDSLEARGWRVEFRTLCDGTLSQVYKADEMGRPDLASIFQGGHENRAVALLEAAAQALGVSE
jgi:hypothetical protein